MIFYRIECKTKEKYNSKTQDEKIELLKTISALNKEVCLKYSNEAIFSVVKLKDNNCTIIAVVSFKFSANRAIEDECNRFLTNIEIEGAAEEIEEITKSTFAGLLRLAERSGYIEDDSDILPPFGLEGRLLDRSSNYSELLIKNPLNFSQAARQTKSLLCGQSLGAEIERIFSGEGPKHFLSHPVHYIISSNDAVITEKMTELLISSLWSAGRLLSRRYSVCLAGNDTLPVEMEGFNRAYLAAEGGAIVIKFELDDNETEFADISQQKMHLLCEMVKKNRQTVLTVLCFNRGNHKLKNTIVELLEKVTFVELSEETVFADKAKAYLKMLAKEKGVESCAALLKKLPKTEKGYLAADLNILFDSWYYKHLRTEVYPQYAAFETAKKKDVKPKGDAFGDLQKMIGLTQAKAVLAQALDYYKAQKLFKEKGVRQDNPAMHMIFTGNPGTAKTSVARLIAQIMKDNNLLAVGDLVEVGRADLVGKYVGWTAPLVKSKFKQAKGSVLFIDEAYSLVDDRDGLYGDEAINTIVQEMENAREDTIVIFAGYPDKMEGFLQKNPGLRSRIAFHVQFSDYTQTELLDIMRLMVKNKKLCLACGAEEKISKIFGSALKQGDFGNGRFARNLLEKALMKQATRLVSMDYDSVTAEIVATLTAEDFEMPQENESKKAAIGFCA